mgnify:CR=1 FL=1
MTDPRIEAAARAICEYAHEREGESVQWHEITEALRGVARRYALRALEAADAAAWRNVSTKPQATKWVQIVSQQGGEVNYAVAQWDYAMHCWRNPELELMYSPAYFTYWRPLSAPPNTEASPAPKTITIPEVRNDRPIPGKGESHS